MWDLENYYRQFQTPALTWVTHCRSWVGDDGPSIVVDHSMMFGDRLAANWAMRLSGFLADLTAIVANECNSLSPVVQESLDRLRAAADADPEMPTPALIHSFVSCFIDDFSM